MTVLADSRRARLSHTVDRENRLPQAASDFHLRTLAHDHPLKHDVTFENRDFSCSAIKQHGGNLFFNPRVLSGFKLRDRTSCTSLDFHLSCLFGDMFKKWAVFDFRVELFSLRILQAFSSVASAFVPMPPS